MDTHYLAGYYLIKLKPIDFGDDKNKIIWTCSQCINYSAFDNWCLSWTHDKPGKEEKKALNLTDEAIRLIQNWTDNRFDKLVNGFPDLSTANEFKNLFYDSRQDIEVLALYFPKQDAELLIDDFSEGNNVDVFNYNNGNLEIRKHLQTGIEEKADPNEEFLGYDFIGVECDGSFHSFYCSNVTKELTNKCKLSTNGFGLFDKVEDIDAVRLYLNDPGSFLEPLPYYVVKVKRVNNANSQQSVPM